MLNSLRNKILIPIAAILFVLVLVIIIFTATTTSTLVEDFSQDRMDATIQAIDAYLGALEQQVHIAVSAVATSAEMISYINSNNQPGLMRYLTERMDFLGVNAIIIADADGYALGRTMLPDVYGDQIGAVPNIAAALREEHITMFSTTPVVPVVLTATSPIYYEGRLIGGVVVNFDIGTDWFLERINNVFGVEATVFAGDTSVASTIIHPDTGQPAVGTSPPEHIVDTVLRRGEDFQSNLIIFGGPFRALYFPLKGAGDNIIGMFFVGLSQESAIATTNNLRLSLIVLGVIGLAVAVFIIWRTAGSISKPLTVVSGFMGVITKKGDIVVRQEEMSVAAPFRKRRDEIGILFESIFELVDWLGEISDNLKKIASGNLDIDVKVRSEYDVLSLSLEKMIDDLNQMFDEVQTSTAQVAAGSRQIADGSQSLAQGSTQQAASVQQLSSSIISIAQKTKENADMAERAALLANNIKASAEKGSGQMDEMMSAVKDINDSSHNIGKVTKSIADIAFQTNILALNAAVEAARAGQHGKGFAVVAEEVRSLAAKSAEAAKDTESLIADSIAKAELGSKIADDTSASLVEIVAGINESNQLVSEIAKTSEEQTFGITQINKGIEQVSNVTSQNSATAEQSAAASQELSGQSMTLEQLISRFKLKGFQQPGLPSPGKFDRRNMRE